MHETTDRPNAKVVDFAAWRAKRVQGELPLFARAVEAGEQALVGTPAPERALLPREIAHREQMLRFLGSTS
jgi:hypothetical protein